MKNILENQESRVHLIEFIINPVVAKNKRCRACPTKIKALYHLFQLHKNLKKEKWSSIYQGKKKISQGADITFRHLTEFIVSPDFLIFGQIHRRKGTTSIYSLHAWVVEFFDFFEKKGMMKDFRKNFSKWKQTFLLRLRKWLIPLLQKGNTLKDILLNKIRTKNSLKGYDQNSLKGYAIKPSGSDEALGGYKSNIECPSVKGMQSVARTLKDRFQLSDGDRNKVMKYFSLNRLQRAIRLGESMLRNGMHLESPIRFYQHCLNKTKWGSVA